MKGEAQLKNCTQKTASSSFLQQMYKQMCLSLRSHCEAQGPTLLFTGESESTNGQGVGLCRARTFLTVRGSEKKKKRVVFPH